MKLKGGKNLATSAASRGHRRLVHSGYFLRCHNVRVEITVARKVKGTQVARPTAESACHLAYCFRCDCCIYRFTPHRRVVSLASRSGLFLQLGEVKGFIRLVQDDDDDDAKAANAATSAAQGGESSSSRRSSAAPRSSSGDEVFLTLPALEAFVEGGDAFLARKERAAQARRLSQEEESSANGVRAEATMENTKNAATGRGEGTPRSRTNSWAAAAAVDGDPDGDGGGTYGKGSEKVGLLLERFRATLARALAAAAATGQNGEDTGGGAGTSFGEDGVREYLDSFDVDGDGVLLPGELVAALRSLGARGEEFFGWPGVNALVSRFRDGGEGPAAAGAPKGASVVKIAVWFDEQGGSRDTRPAADATAVDRRRSSSGGSASNADHSGGKGGDKRNGGAETRTGGGGSVAGEALRRAVRLSEAKGVTLERTFARLDDNGDGFITLRQLLRGLDQLGVFEQVARAYS